MSDKSNKYGYVGVDIPAQSFGSNKGVFNPAEINDLVANNQWTTFGQLELIETQTVSSSFADFTTLNENTYNVHLITLSNIYTTGQTEIGLRFSDDNGATFEITPYEFANLRGNAVGTADDRRSTAQQSIRLAGDTTGNYANNTLNGYVYIYNAGDSTKYTGTTSHISFMFNNTHYYEFGGGVYGTTSSINAIRIGQGILSAFTSGTLSLYGIRYS